jgi:hypothetical protein
MHSNRSTQPNPAHKAFLARSEGRGAVRNEGALRLEDTVSQRELELGDKELLDVWAADVLGLLNLDNAEDLQIIQPPFTTDLNTLCLRELSGSGHGDERPCPGRASARHPHATGHGTLCTCCACQSESRSGARYQSS